MRGRGRSRRHPNGGSLTSPSSSGRAVRLGMVAVLMCSVVYLLCSHAMLYGEDDNNSSSVAGIQSATRRKGEPGFSDPDSMHSYQRGSDTEYEIDPRQKVVPASGSADVELRCPGGKTPDVDLSYWKDIPADKTFESPWGASARKAREAGMPQYVTFEPDHGGFNNIRMAMETVLVFARATGRTLVMPPAQKFYLLNKPAVEFGDMFPIEDINAYMDIVSMEAFLIKEGLSGNLGAFPPDKKSSGHKKDVLEGYLREVATLVPHWDHMTQALVFGPSPGNPEVPGDEASQLWLNTFTTDKRLALGYTKEMQEARHIHFRTSGAGKGGEKGDEYRLFTHFYTFIAFTDPVAERHHRRLVRDVVHFREGLFCVASTIVARLRAAGEGDPGRWSGWYGEAGGVVGAGGVPGLGGGKRGEGDGGGGGGGGVLRRAGFSTYHIRRGDFQYTRMKPPAQTILDATAELLLPGEVIYIATDERDKSFFDPFRQNHRIFFLDDFKDVLTGVDPSYYLMIDTIVAAMGRTFIGTWRSTFTGYITRLRGYYRYPTEFSWYFWDESAKAYQPLSLAKETTPRSPFFMREWPNAWEDIDADINSDGDMAVS